MQDRIPVKQQRAVISLLSQPSVEAAAADVGVNPSTLHRWLKTDRFCQALKDAQAEAFSATVRVITSATTEASAYLLSVVRDEEAARSERIRACQIILERAPQLRYEGDVERRLQDLENAKTRLVALEGNYNGGQKH